MPEQRVAPEQIDPAASTGIGHTSATSDGSIQIGNTHARFVVGRKYAVYVIAWTTMNVPTTPTSVQRASRLAGRSPSSSAIRNIASAPITSAHSGMSGIACRATRQ